jgi:hypothetical protein
MYQIQFHDKVSHDLIVWHSHDQALKIIDKIYYRLSLSSEPDGRVIYVLGCIHKGLTKKIFDRRLEVFLRRFYDF